MKVGPCRGGVAGQAVLGRGAVARVAGGEASLASTRLAVVVVRTTSIACARVQKVGGIGAGGTIGRGGARARGAVVVTLVAVVVLVSVKVGLRARRRVAGVFVKVRRPRAGKAVRGGDIAGRAGAVTGLTQATRGVVSSRALLQALVPEVDKARIAGETRAVIWPKAGRAGCGTGQAGAIQVLI